MRQAEQFRYLILAAQREGNRLLASALRELGLTPAWAEAIVILHEHTPRTVRELGDLLVCEGDHPSRLVERMARAGLVNRLPSPTDRRAVELRLSLTAESLVPQIRTVENRIYDYVDQLLPAVDIEVAIATLRSLVIGTPAGVAFERRIQRQAEQPG